jgi:hypothetical protein
MSEELPLVVKTYDWYGANWALVPEHFRNGLKAYIETGRPTGDGLRGLLENGPVFDVLAHLDDTGRPRAFNIMRFLHNYAPHQAWGSKDKVALWIKRGGYHGGAAR